MRFRGHDSIVGSASADLGAAGAQSWAAARDYIDACGARGAYRDDTTGR